MNKFYICNYCGLTFKAKRKPRKCKTCKDMPIMIGEMQIKW